MLNECFGVSLGSVFGRPVGVHLFQFTMRAGANPREANVKVRKWWVLTLAGSACTSVTRSEVQGICGSQEMRMRGGSLGLALGGCQEPGHRNQALLLAFGAKQRACETLSEGLGLQASRPRL